MFKVWNLRSFARCVDSFRLVVGIFSPLALERGLRLAHTVPPHP